MTKIKTYTIKTPVIASDKWIGTDGITGETKNFSAEGVAAFTVAGLAPVEGGTFKTTEIDIDTLDTDVATTVNAMSPAYDVAQYEQVWFNIEGLIYILKSVDVTIGVGGVTLTNDDFIIVPANTGATGNGIASIALYSTVGLVKTYRITYTDASTFDFAVSDGTNGTNGTNGVNADMTRTSTTSNAIASSGSKTFAYSASTNLGWLIGTRLRFAKDISNYMEGTVTAVSSTSVTATMDNAVGSGTYTAWNIGIAGDKGDSGTPNAIVTEDTGGSLTITSQSLANFDYVLNFQLSDGKCFVTGSVTNNTGGSLGANSICAFTNSAYYAKTGLPTLFYAGANNISAGISQQMQVTTNHLNLLGNIEDGKTIVINGYYFVN